MGKEVIVSLLFQEEMVRQTTLCGREVWSERDPLFSSLTF